MHLDIDGLHGYLGRCQHNLKARIAQGASIEFAQLAASGGAAALPARPQHGCRDALKLLTLGHLPEALL